MSQGLGGRNVTTERSVVDDECQIAHCQVAGADVANEREAVCKLEVANCDHVALEARGYGARRISIHGAAIDSARANRRWRRRPVEVQRASSILGRGAEWIGRGVRNRETRIESIDVRDKREQQIRLAEVYGDDGRCRGGIHKSRNR